MSGPIPDNALLTWLQDETNNPFPTSDDIRGMYSHFSNACPDPITSIQQDDWSHCFLIFVEDQNGESCAQILHHLAQYPTRLGSPPSPYDRKWFMMVDQPVRGNTISIELLGNLFALRAEASMFIPEQIQRELANGSHPPGSR